MIGFVREVVRVLRLPCQEHAALFSRQLDEPLPRATAAGLRVHILYCAGCKQFRTQIRRLRDLTRSLGQELNAGESMPAAAKQRVLSHTARSSKKI
ncbi:MAG: hypothetical protein WC718_13545 [Phycisphaerales bacterium]|jgi:hypothetical protein